MRFAKPGTAGRPYAVLAQDLWAQSLLWGLSCQLKLVCHQDPRHKGDAPQHSAMVRRHWATLLLWLPPSGVWPANTSGASQ